jgi:hypothetical protein
MPATSVDVDHLFTLTATVEISKEQVIANGPQGSRVAANVPGGSFEGPRLTGRVIGPGGDWVTNRANGTFRLDVRLLLVTDDGASILMTYHGVGRRGDGENILRTAPTFETGDERYTWLNDVQAVGIGRSVPGEVVYEVYALR